MQMYIMIPIRIIIKKNSTHVRSSDVHVKSKTGVAVLKLENLTGHCFEHQKGDYTVEG